MLGEMIQGRRQSACPWLPSAAPSALVESFALDHRRLDPSGAQWLFSITRKATTAPAKAIVAQMNMTTRNAETKDSLTTC